MVPTLADWLTVLNTRGKTDYEKLEAVSNLLIIYLPHT